ncbi:MAG: peptidase E [Thermoleophilia bacterium]|nr:peptidase E [Thermoleophilia bacterium]
MEGYVVAMGGGGFLAGDTRSPLDDLLLSFSPRPQPRIVFLPTAVGDSERAVGAFREAFATRECEPETVALFGIPDHPAERVAAADVIVVSGGNTANLLALWRLHEIDAALRHAWQGGAALGGVSAGANCWFEACVTDSFSADLDGLGDGLGFLAGSFCPHFDGEDRRRPVYTRLVADGFPGGIACDDGAAAVYRGTEFVEMVSDRAGARGYRVSAAAVEPIETRCLR